MIRRAHISEYFVEGTNREVSHVLLHITEPSTKQERSKGVFFALCEVNHGDLAYIKEIQSMIETVEDAFYSTEDSFAKSLEVGIEAANKRSHHLLEAPKETKLHCFLGALHEDQLAFAFHGDMSANVIYHGKNGELKLLDILSDDKQKSNHVFTSIVEGSLNENDYLHICTRPVARIISSDRLPSIFEDKNPDEISEYIGSTLEKTIAPQSFGGVICQISQFDEEEKEEVEDEEEEKMEAKRPKKILQVATKKEKPSKTIHHTPETNYRPRTNTPDIPLGRRIVEDIGRFLVYFFQKIFRGIWLIIKGSAKWIKYFFFLLTNKSGQREATKSQMKSDIKSVVSGFTSLPLGSKILFVLTILFVSAFIGSILYLQLQENKQAYQQVKQNKIFAIENKIEAAQAKMVYDEDSAFTLVKEAELLSQQALEEYGEDIQITQHYQMILDLLAELKKLESTKADIVADLSDREENSLSSIALIDDHILVFDKDTPSTYRISTLTQSQEKIQNQSLDNIIRANTPKEEDAMVLLRADSSIGLYDSELGSIKAADITHASNQTQLSDIFVYNTRLYAVSPNDKQIYRYSKTGSGYDKGSSWLTGGAALADGALSLAIDGDIFVSYTGGAIEKFSRGQKEAFAISGLEPELEYPIKIWTYNGVKEIFVLDPPQRRIVLLDKSGKLIKQLTASNFDDLKDMAVQPEKKTIYVLSGKMVLKVGY
ncbi:hypothetical protein H6758_04995 [Candidatus Nomurabacteria bacterium]|nr:hypothetical protein [Candidatus Nomurabacteria bacterium]